MTVSAADIALPSATGQLMMERRMQQILDRKLRLRCEGPYRPRTNEGVAAALHRLFAAEGLRDVTIEQLSRMTGGASKEQFAFTLSHAESTEAEALVLRMDPYESVVDTCRGREAEIIQAVAPYLPVPRVRSVDAEGEHLGQPGVVIALVPGVSMPTQMAGRAVSGIGGSYGEIGAALTPQFLRHLVTLHGLDPAALRLALFDLPRPNTTDAALWQVNWLSQCWRNDAVAPTPIITLVERWLRENAPRCDAPCVVHGDYRMGNFLFTEPAGDMTAVLDWELAHVGDFHEDIAYTIRPRFGSIGPDGELLVSGLIPKQQFLDEYERLSGRHPLAATLRYYEVFSAWKSAVVVRASAIRAAQEGNNHQDVLLTWLASGTGNHLRELADLMDQV